MKPKPRGQAGEDAPSSSAGRFERRAQGREPGQDESVSLLAAIAHRLSQPLTALRGTLELARLKAKSVAEYRSAIEKALESAEHLAWQVQSLRELAEASSPAGDLALTDFDQVTDSVVEDLRPIAASRGVSIKSRLEKGLEAQTHPEHLYQALLKVVHHAILRSPAGKKVRFELRSVSDGAQWTITDDGTPFPFAETELSLSTLFAGQSFPGSWGESVLGLVTAKQFIAALGGSLSIQNRTDGENRVLIHLPTLRGKNS